MNEPSVLDYLKATLFPWKYDLEAWDMEAINNRTDDIDDSELMAEASLRKNQVIIPRQSIPWYLILAVVFAIIGQIALEPPDQAPIFASFFYGLAVIMVGIAFFQRDPIFEGFAPSQDIELSTDIKNPQYISLAISFALLVIAFLAFRKTAPDDIRFTTLNVVLWLLSLLSFTYALFDLRQFNTLRMKVSNLLIRKKISLQLTPWFFLAVATVLVVLFFRFFQLNLVLGEMFSDHAEKLLDVYDVLDGQYHIFFVRNTGREFFQFYLTAFVAVFFQTGISFLSLKIGTALAGFAALPYIYKLGNELGNRWVGLLAFFFAGISYWHNLISRVGLRFPLYPLFAAPALFYLIRGLRQKRRNDFIYAGIAIGFGLHGYSSTRFLPFVILAGVILFWLHAKNRGHRLSMVFALTIVVIASFIVFLPLFKYILINPDAVNYRALTRLGTIERNYQDLVILVFLKNLWNALTMFFYSNGNTWVHSIPLRPALDVVSAAFYFIGSLIVLGRYLRERNWEDIFLLLSVPLLMMPSILSLAFPEENPSLNRTGGAIVPVFILVAIGFQGVFSRFLRLARGHFQKWVILALAFVLLASSASFNYDLVFNQFNRQFLSNAWNSSQMGAVIRGFSDSVGNAEDAFVVPSPHWVDTRAVGIAAGFPTRDFALWPERFTETIGIEDSKLFILKPDNTSALAELQILYPQGALYRYDSGREGKDFLIFNVPAQIAPTFIEDVP